jgi:GxxExxY protein
VNQEAIGKEFAYQAISFKPQPIIQISYKGKPLDKTYQPDFICYGEIILEIKAISGLSGIEEAQLINYLKATGLKVGLLINFGSKSLEYKRFVYNLRIHWRELRGEIYMERENRIEDRGWYIKSSQWVIVLESLRLPAAQAPALHVRLCVRQ